MAIYGIVVNPKSAEPVIVKPELSYVNIYRLAGGQLQLEGEGYFDKKDGGIAEATGYPRVHTPDGVRSRGTGTGVCLYTGLCLTAHLVHEGVIQHRVGPYTGDGISSDEHREPPAEEWWEANTERGLTERGHYEIEHEVPFQGEDISDLADESSVAEYLEVHSVDYISATASGVRMEPEAVDGNTYPFDSAFEHNLVAVSFKANQHEDFGKACAEQVTTNDVDLAAILALNLSGASPDFYEGLQLVLRQEGASQDQLQNFRLRWLAASASGKGHRAGWLASQLSPNAADVEAAVREGEALRKTLGWDRLADVAG
jgi:hypothetical protein